VTEDPPGLHVLADSDQLRQLVWNLCLNSIQAMPEGGTLTVSLQLASQGRRSVNSSIRQLEKPKTPIPGDKLATRPADQATSPSHDDEWVEIAFQDTGRGIPPSELERIFDPFYTTRPSGTGLGLAIARNILESMGGRIEVTSPPNVGTTFRLWLRQAPATVGRQAGQRSGFPG
jgi:signal transduction histidine kinase